MISKTVHQEFQELTSQIRRLEDMICENKERMKELRKRNQELRGTIEQLKEKRREVLFVGSHVKDR